MNYSDTHAIPAWPRALRWLFAVVFLAATGVARADCDIPDSTTTDKPFTASDVELSFLNADCQLIQLAVDTTFYRYYSYPTYPNTNIGRYFTLDFFTLNSEAIVQLALYPFPPNPQYQNFAYTRELVTIMAGVDLYHGYAAPQPVGSSGSCYAGGATQYFFAGDNISTNSSLGFSVDGELTRDTRYPNPYGVGDPCNVLSVPEPATAPLFTGGLLLLAALAGTVGRVRS